MFLRKILYVFKVHFLMTSGQTALPQFAFLKVQICINAPSPLIMEVEKEKNTKTVAKSWQQDKLSYGCIGLLLSFI